MAMFFFAGIDIGSTMTKVAILNQDRATLATIIYTTDAEHRRLANLVMKEALSKAGLAIEQISYIVATGYGRINVPFADKQITEISCHAKGVSHFFPDAHTIVEIGGQDCKGIKLVNGRVANFAMNDKCAAGTGRFLEVIAEVLGVKLEDVGPRSLLAKEIVKISSTCTVFAEQEVVSRLSEGASIEDILAGLHDAIARRVLGMVEHIKIQREVVVTGGGAKNIGLVKAIERRLGYTVLIPPEPLLTGAIGAAILGLGLVKKQETLGKTIPRAERALREVTFFG